MGPQLGTDWGRGFMWESHSEGPTQADERLYFYFTLCLSYIQFSSVCYFSSTHCFCSSHITFCIESSLLIPFLISFWRLKCSLSSWCLFFTFIILEMVCWIEPFYSIKSHPNISLLQLNYHPSFSLKPPYLPHHPCEDPTILWGTFVFFVIQDLKVEAEQVDRDGVFPGIVLLAACEEGLREEESWHPEHSRSTVIIPVLKTQQGREEGDIITKTSQNTEDPLAFWWAQLAELWLGFACIHVNP